MVSPTQFMESCEIYMYISVMCHVTSVICHVSSFICQVIQANKQPQLQTLPVQTSPICAVGLFTKSDQVILKGHSPSANLRQGANHHTHFCSDRGNSGFTLSKTALKYVLKLAPCGEFNECARTYFELLFLMNQDDITSQLNIPQQHSFKPSVGAYFLSTLGWLWIV